MGRLLTDGALIVVDAQQYLLFMVYIFGFKSQMVANRIGQGLFRSTRMHQFRVAA